jgi:hypothetical protein
MQPPRILLLICLQRAFSVLQGLVECEIQGGLVCFLAMNRAPNFIPLCGYAGVIFVPISGVDQ